MTSSQIKRTQETQVPGAHKVARTVVRGSKAGTVARTLRQKEEQRIQQDIAEYRNLKALIDAHQAELKEITARLLAAVKKDPDGKIFIEDGSYSVRLNTRASWTYSLKTQRLQLDLKKEQEWEQQQNIAQNNPTEFLTGNYTARS